MLTANYLMNVANQMVSLWGDVESDILADITKRIAKMGVTETSEWQMLKLREMGVLQTDIANVLAKATKISQKNMYQTIVKACQDALAFDDALYINAGYYPLPLKESAALQDVIQAGIRKTNGLMQNFTRTTANTASQAFENSMDRVWLQVNSGAFSPETALRRAVNDLAKKGIGAIAYPSGHIDKSEVAARRAMITGLNQTTAELQLARMDELGQDLVEVTAHAGARPEHAVWQGQVYSRSGKTKGYKNFYAETGYGTGEGLCGWNCYHNFYPFFAGLSKQAFERDPAKRLGKTNDQMYEESQKQRYFERKVRESKRECLGLISAKDAAKDPTLKAYFENDLGKASALLKKRQQALKDYCELVDRPKEGDRIIVPGYNHSAASKVTWAAKKPVFSGKKDLKWHWEKHAAEFPECKNAKDYLEAARKMLDDPVQDGVLEECVRKDGSVSRYRFASNEFLATSDDGGIRTYFKPSDKAKYWEEEYERNK